MQQYILIFDRSKTAFRQVKFMKEFASIN
jgi:hypothetical protein